MYQNEMNNIMTKSLISIKLEEIDKAALNKKENHFKHTWDV